jgi:hypothetical protein
MSSPLMNDVSRQVYYVLWQYPEGLTKYEVTQLCEGQGIQKTPGQPWEKQVALMAKMGITQKGNKRHCRVKNKEDVVWTLTDASVVIKPKAGKPSGKQYIKAVAQLEMLIVHHDTKADGLVTPELRKLYDWVRDKVPDPKP